MGLTERDYPDLGEPDVTTHLFLLPGEQLTWAHWRDAVDNMWDVILGLAGQRGNLMSSGFDFKIEVNGIGGVGHGNLTSFPLRANWR